MTSNSNVPETTVQEDLGNLEEARRKKLQAIKDMGIDPWGGRFDRRSSIAEIRQRIAEVKFQSEAGEVAELPDLDADPELNFRQWLADQGKGELIGPEVRAAGRIVLLRDTGKLKFIDIRDQSGQIQLFVGKKQVGDENWQLSDCFDLGDLIGVDGQLRRTKTGEITIFVKDLHFLCKSIEPPPEKHHGLNDPELRQRMRYLDMTYTEGVIPRFLDRTAIVASVRKTLAELLSLLAEGKIKPVVAERIPLAQAARAHALLERGGYAGKVVLVTGA